MILGLFIALGVIVVDQISKYVVMHYILSEYAALIVTPFFAVVRAWNTGVSFSMFNK